MICIINMIFCWISIFLCSLVNIYFICTYAWYGVIIHQSRITGTRKVLLSLRLTGMLWIHIEQNIDGLVQDCSISSVLAVGIWQSGTKPLIWCIEFIKNLNEKEQVKDVLQNCWFKIFVLSQLCCSNTTIIQFCWKKIKHFKPHLCLNWLKDLINLHVFLTLRNAGTDYHSWLLDIASVMPVHIFHHHCIVMFGE